jgi:hypothetical protein
MHHDVRQFEVIVILILYYSISKLHNKSKMKYKMYLKKKKKKKIKKKYKMNRKLGPYNIFWMEKMLIFNAYNSTYFFHRNYYI